jgi:biopolymer transport protein TolQ
MGLVAAIPAVIAYNRYSSETNRLDGRFEDFSEEFLNIMHRQLPAGN